ncbi:MAG: aminopeptidase P family protein [Sphingomonadaceae bacterium]|nr:aminopeptidase P family protein [Sphingomonadaceae bacterium]
MSIHADRLAALRAELSRSGLDGFLVPIADEHGSEYVGAYAQRLAWLTGFDGSAGAAAVLSGVATLFVDGRYTLQAAAQVDAQAFTIISSVDTPLTDWLGQNAQPGMRIGFDPWLHSEKQATDLKAAAEGRGATLVSVTVNPIDALWSGQPAPSDAPLAVQPDRLAGRSSAEKRGEIGRWLEETGADAAVITALDSIAWLYNVRGADVAHTPVPLAFTVLHRDGTAELFVDEPKLTPEVRAHLGNAVRLAPRAAFAEALGSLGGKVVAADPASQAHAVFEALRRAGARIVAKRDPVLLPKAIKNAAEIAGMRAAHVRDGVAIARFLHWIDAHGPSGEVDELAAMAQLEAFRRETGALKDTSFTTIMGAGPNGAIIHYHATPETSRTIRAGDLLLIDSGGQYQDGTTDITRTVAIQPDAVTAERRDRFTRVLQAHIAVACARFPLGAKGSQIDGLARRPLWEAGLDYAHGTGHGVGCYLAVHEGPQRIASYGGGDEPLKPGMILSNEPGYYKQGEYGIRIENLLLVTPDKRPGDEKDMLAFHDLTLAAIDRRLIEPALLTERERAWVDTYHARVAAEIAPLLPSEVAEWLRAACAPL